MVSCQGDLQYEDFYFHQILKLTPTNESCFRDALYQCLCAYCAQAAAISISWSSWLWLPQKSALGRCNLWNSFWKVFHCWQFLAWIWHKTQALHILISHYTAEVVYFCSLQPRPFFSGVLQNFRVQAFPPTLPYKQPVMFHHSACQEKEGNRNVCPWMCWKSNTLVWMYTTCTQSSVPIIFLGTIEITIYSCMNLGFRRPWLLCSAT